MKIEKNLRKIAVIVAGGSGSRMGNAVPKQFLLLNGKPVLWHTIRVFLNAFDDIFLKIVLPKSSFDEGKKIVDSFVEKEKITLVEGGETRFHSVKNGLKTIKENSIIFVHDGVRCLISEGLIKKCYAQALEKGSAVPSVASTDSIRFLENGNNKMLQREKVQIIQTPQTFRSDILLPAFEQEYNERFTDEANVVEYFGKKIFLIEGEYSNIKITLPKDLILAEYLLSEKEK